MERTFTRQELYHLVWSKPVTQLVSELGTTTGVLTALLQRADIPKPAPGYWMRKQFGKPVDQPPLPPAPDGCAEPLRLVAVRQAASKRQLPIHDDAVEAAEDMPQPQGTGTPKQVPAKPTRITREELYDAVWTTPMSRLAGSFGVSGNGLAKICKRAGIPYPPRGYWAKHAAGSAPARPPLPAASGGQVIIIRPTPLPSPPPVVPELRKQSRESTGALVVADRVTKPHKVVAAWLADHETKKRQARSERDPWRRKLYSPAEFTDTDRRRHRVLDTLFKALEREGGRVTQLDRGPLTAEFQGEKIEFQLRIKQKQVRRPLTDSEKRWRLPGDRDWKMELVPTGTFVFEIKTGQWPHGLPRQWLETDRNPIESMLPDILATFVAAGPLLVRMRLDQEAAQRERQLAEQRRYEERKLRKRDANRWRRFREMATAWHELTIARNFVEALKSTGATSLDDIDGHSVEEWLAWAEEWLERADPTANGTDGVFRLIAEVNDWTDRDYLCPRCRVLDLAP